MQSLNTRAISDIARTNTTPIRVPRTQRQIPVDGLTSVPAGKMVPLAAWPLLREDRQLSTDLRISFELMETAEPLLNGVIVTVKAYLVPHLALPRFSGMDELNRSYAGLPNQEGGAVTPYFQTMTAGAYGSIPIHKYMGFHAGTGDTINTTYIEAYNEIWNFRARNRSKSLLQRTALTTSLAPAFWQHEQFKHIVPDFDQAAIDGAVSLSLVNTSLPVKGLGFTGSPTSAAGGTVIRETGGTTQTPASTMLPGTTLVAKATGVGAAAIPEIYAQLSGAGIQVSLANIELAKKVQAFADLKKGYNGLTDNYAIDMLMDGLTIPEQMWKQPVLLADKSQVFGVSRRWATDGASLTDSVVTGLTAIDLHIVTPPVPTGGVIMIVAEITPEQLFERQRDPFLYTTDPQKLPQFLRDELDPEKVDVVTNGEVDTAHATPNGVFGYVPMSWKWAHGFCKIGGRFFRPSADTAFDEDRQRIWAVETPNPALSADFYICNTFHQKPFVVTTQDIGEAMWRGSVVIEGNTVFGDRLVENDNDYAEVLAEAPTTKIAK